jgi:glyoxylase-like metal-dependent hydrolase (beta-lactamase superfamily II)
MTDPPQAIDALVRRLEICHEKYAAISALRHYWPEVFAEYAGRDGHMPIRKAKPVPDCLRHFDTTWMILSETKAAFAMDCGSTRVIREIRQLIDRGEVRAVEGLWVTHYHDDHTDAIPEFCKTFGCPCITDRSVAAVIGDPLAWRLPCLSPHAIRVDRPTHHGESWTWHEFKMTACNFPGQTLYHSGLLVEGRGLRMLFVGDSFTPAGIDDYCAYNRNWLGPNVGFDRCVALIEDLQPTHIFNCHVADAFDFRPEDCRFMRDNLAQRLKLFSQLLPWDHPNYGLDEQWVRCHPYEQTARPGQQIEFHVVVTNHSADTRTAACRAVPPRAWQQAENNSRLAPPAINPQTGDWTQFLLSAGQERKVSIKLPIPHDAPPGRYVIPVDLRYDTRSLPQLTEAIVVIPEPAPQ